jgi:hypothetical protein
MTRRLLVLFSLLAACGRSGGTASVDTLALKPLVMPTRSAELLFTPRRSIAWVDSTHLAIVNATDTCVVVLGLDGSVQRVGRGGDGPGEFRVPIAVASVRAGGILVLDLMGKIHRFSASLLPTGTSTAGRWPSTILGMRGDTAVLVTQLFRPVELRSRLISLSAPGAEELHDLVRFDTLDEAFMLDPDAPADDGLPGAAAALLPDGGFVVAQEDNYRMIWLDPEGAVRNRAGRPGLVAALPSAQEIARQREGIAAFEKRTGEARMASEMRARLERDATRPMEHLTKLVADERGWTWALTTRGAGTDSWFDLFDSEGRYRAVASVPGESWAFAVYGGRIALLQPTREDDPEVDALVRVYDIGPVTDPVK